jgi:membrane associated rhomboid family serine protease
MTLPLIIVTALISILAFNREELLFKLQFNPWQVWHRKQWYRLLTHALIHADWIHLFINMFVFYSFGRAVEFYFGQLATAGLLKAPVLWFLLLYMGGILFSTTTTLWKQKDNHWYNAVGASGGVSAVVFASIFFAPWHKLLLFAIIPIPGILFGAMYLFYSHYMSRRSNDNINHEAHLLGAVFGLVFPLFIDLKLAGYFFEKLLAF